MNVKRHNSGGSNNQNQESSIPKQNPQKSGGGGKFFLLLATLGAAAGAYYYFNEDECKKKWESCSKGPWGKKCCKSCTKPCCKVDYEEVKKDIVQLLDSNPKYDDGSYGPLIIRLAWHASGTYDKASGTGGSNGSTMRFPPESDHGANNGLAIARDLLEPLKQKYPGISYADLWTLAGAVAVEHMKGPKIAWKPGRTDAPDNKTAPPDGRLPDAAKGADHIREIFYRMGFNDREIVALIGAHTLGRCHTDRSGYSGPWTRSPTMISNSFYQELLEQKWVQKKWDGPEQFQDAATGELMMLPGDLALIKDPQFKKIVEMYASNEEVWLKDFGDAFSKLLELGVGCGCPMSKKESTQ